MARERTDRKRTRPRSSRQAPLAAVTAPQPRCNRPGAWSAHGPEAPTTIGRHL